MFLKKGNKSLGDSGAVVDVKEPEKLFKWRLRPGALGLNAKKNHIFNSLQKLELDLIEQGTGNQ